MSDTCDETLKGLKGDTGPMGPPGPKGDQGEDGINLTPEQLAILFIRSHANNKRMIARRSRPRDFIDGWSPVYFEQMTVSKRFWRWVRTLVYNAFVNGHVHCPRCELRVENTGCVFNYAIWGLFPSRTYAYPDNCPHCDADFKKIL